MCGGGLWQEILGTETAVILDQDDRGTLPMTGSIGGITASTGWRGETPLWYYVLREADACTGGHRLGPVGGKIVTEMLVGLIDADTTSFRHDNQEWRPRKTLRNLL